MCQRERHRSADPIGGPPRKVHAFCNGEIGEIAEIGSCLKRFWSFADVKRSCVTATFWSRLKGNTLQTVVLKVAMSCGGCSGAVTRVLQKMEGVESFDIDMKAQKVTVKGNVKAEDVFETVSKTGKKTAFWVEPENKPSETVAATTESAENKPSQTASVEPAVNKPSETVATAEPEKKHEETVTVVSAEPEIKS